MEKMTQTAAEHEAVASHLLTGCLAFLAMLEHVNTVLVKEMPATNRPGWAHEMLTEMGAVLTVARQVGFLPTSTETDRRVM